MNSRKKILHKNALYAGTIVILVLLLSMYTVSALRIARSGNSSRAAAKISETISVLHQFRIGINETEKEVNNYLISANEKKMDEINRLDQETKNRLAQIRIACNENLPASLSFVQQMDSFYHASRITLHAILQLKKNGRADSRTLVYEDQQYDFIRGQIIEKYDRIYQLAIKRLGEIQKTGQQETRDRILLLLAFSLTTILFLGLIILLFWTDIRKKNRDLESLHQYEKSTEGILVTDQQNLIRFTNNAALFLLGKEQENITGISVLNCIPQIGNKKDNDIFLQSQQALERKDFSSYEFFHAQTQKWLQVNILPEKKGRTIYIRDISMVKHAENETKKSQRLYAFTSKCNDLVLHAHEESHIYTELCQIAVETGGFVFAWVGLPDPETKWLEARYKAGKGQDYTEEARFSAAEIPEGLGPSGMAFRTGKYYYCNNIAEDPVMKIWAKPALARGFYSSISLPVFVQGKVETVITLYAPRIDFFTDEEQLMLVRVTENIGHALTTLRIESEKQKVELELQKVNEAVRQSPASVVITDRNGVIEYVNPAFCRLTGYAPEEVIGKTPSLLKTGHTSKQEYDTLWSDITNFREWRGEFLNLKKNGETYWEHAIISPIVNGEEKITHFVAVKENITERKKLEQERQRIFDIIENTMVYIATSNMERDMVYANKAMREMLGIPVGDDITKYNAAAFRTKEGEHLIQKMFTDLMETGKWVGETSYRSLAGKIIPVLQVLVLHKNEQGEPQQISTTAIDLTRIRESEKSLEKLTEELREFAKHLQHVREVEKNRIMHEMHDELGQGLAALMFDANWIKTHLNDDRKKLENKLNEMITSISERINSFLKIYSAANPLLLQELGLQGAVQSLVTQHIRNTNTETLFHSNFEGEIFSEPVGLAAYRIVQEALRNTELYAKAKKVVVELMKRNDKLEVIVSDDGTGFDLTLLSDRLHYGIMEMRERAYALGGSFRIESSPGKGTLIEVILPLGSVEKQ